MNAWLHRSLLTFGWICFTATFATAQQNLFNVPSGEITKPGNLFFQQQFNFTYPTGSSNSTFDIGVGRGWEIGFNVLDLNFYDRPGTDSLTGPDQVNPDLLFNFQKGFELIEDRWSLGIGSQIGFNPALKRRDVRLLNFSWAISQWQVRSEADELRARLYAGAFFANTAYGGQGDRFGVLLGGEMPIIPERFSLQFDYIGGNREISACVFGGVYTFRSGWQLSLGAQVPSIRADVPYGLVVELTLPGLPLLQYDR